MESSSPNEQALKYWMRHALSLAQVAAKNGEIPVGAVVLQVDDADHTQWKIVGESGNLKESAFDPLGHAEIIAIRQATQRLGQWRLNHCTLFVTLEPCLMCAGAIIQARIGQVVYGALDPKAGAVASLYQVLGDSRLNHQPRVIPGILADECGQILREFFAHRRLQ